MKFKLKGNDIQKILFWKKQTKKQAQTVLFYDYDGKLLHSYSNDEFLSMNSMPNLPDRTGENLTCDGWNWTLRKIKEQINNVGGVVNVGAIYHTTDNKTHITCRPTETYPTASICLTPTVSNAVTVDWGDGSSDTWSSTSQVTKTHTYSNVTDSSVYDIAITCSAGTYSFGTYITGTKGNNQSSVYTDIRLSNNVTSFGNYCFSDCHSLQSVTIPNSVISTGIGSFNNCYSLRSATTPNSLTSLNEDFFQYCRSLKSVAISGCVTSFNNCFPYCYSLEFVTIPNGVTGLGSACFWECSSLRSIIIPDSVKSLNYGSFYRCGALNSVTIPNTITSFGNNCFDECSSLSSIVIPSGVTSIGEYCFQNCFSLRRIYMKPTTPPTLTNVNALNNTGSSFRIYVPSGALNTYRTATNWTTFSSYMMGYNF